MRLVGHSSRVLVLIPHKGLEPIPIRAHIHPYLLVPKIIAIQDYWQNSSLKGAMQQQRAHVAQTLPEELLAAIFAQLDTLDR